MNHFVAATLSAIAAVAVIAVIAGKDDIRRFNRMRSM